MAAIEQINNQSKFKDWVIVTNELSSYIGDRDNLDSINKTDLVAIINEVFANVGDKTNLTTTDQSNLVSAVNELDNIIGDGGLITGSIISNLVQHANTITQNSTDITTNATNISTNSTNIGTNTTAIANINTGDVLSDQTPLTNLVKNNGRFANDSITSIAATTFNTASTLFNVENNAIFLADDQFIDDNSNNGGAGGSMGANMVSLLTAQGEQTRLNGYEFFILSILAGNGTNNPVNVSAIDYYPVSNSGNIFIGAIDSNVTFTFWLKVDTTSVNVILGDSNVDTFIDGVAHDFNTPVTSVDGWIHVRQTLILTNNFHEYLPAIYAESGTTILVALPSLFNSYIAINQHKGLI